MKKCLPFVLFLLSFCVLWLDCEKDTAPLLSRRYSYRSSLLSNNNLLKENTLSSITTLDITGISEKNVWVFGYLSD
ncbi:MAG: hypothetical protein P8184_17445 [Calditrichia bacterium]